MNRLAIVRACVVSHHDIPVESKHRQSGPAAEEHVIKENSALDILQLDQEKSGTEHLALRGDNKNHSNFQAKYKKVSLRSPEAHPAPTSTTSAPESSLPSFQQWVTARHLGQFAAVFDSSGFADVALLTCLTQAETELMLSESFAHCRCTR